ncbi:Inosine/uridine-preferring nucleoside hydrolase domain-containing protein, partial [Russula brevipes]
MTRYIWLDCDPGHDDAAAILLALHCTDIHLLGVSTVRWQYHPRAREATAENTKINAARCLHAFAAPEHVKVHGGAAAPLLRHARHDSEIHGPDGLGGVEGLPSGDSAPVRALMDDARPAVEAIAAAIERTRVAGAGAKMTTIVASGPLTNIALFVSVYPHLLDAVERIVFMGGGIGIGNRSPVAEFNILCDPEAAQIVLNAPVPKTMIPLNVTHKAIVTDSVHAKLLNPTSLALEAGAGVASSPLRHTLSTLIAFFRARYKSTFSFMDGPPLHDALTIAYVYRPELVDVELAGTHSSGQTVADLRGRLKLDDTWGRTGKNCEVATDLDVCIVPHCLALCMLTNPTHL